MHRTKRSNQKPFVYFEPMCTSKYPASEHKRERQKRFIFSFFSSGDEVLSSLTSEIIPEIKAIVSPSTHITKTTRQILTVINKLIDFFPALALQRPKQWILYTEQTGRFLKADGRQRFLRQKMYRTKVPAEFRQ